MGSEMCIRDSFYERIIATNNANDWIDGLTGGGSIASLNVDLSTDSLTVSNLPGIGSFTSLVEGFENVRGSNTADQIIGDNGENTLIGNGGNDVIDGGAGNDVIDGGIGNDLMMGGAGNDTYTFGDGIDVIDYSTLQDSITLVRGGTVDKGELGLSLIHI